MNLSPSGGYGNRCVGASVGRIMSLIRVCQVPDKLRTRPELHSPPASKSPATAQKGWGRSGADGDIDPMDRSDLEPVTLERLLALCRQGAAAGRLLGRIGPAGVTVLQLGILADLDRAGALHLRELARRQSCRRQSVDEAIRSLAASGWIRPVPATDRRLRRWALDPDGAAQLGRVRDRLAGFPSSALLRVLTFDGRERCWEW